MPKKVPLLVCLGLIVIAGTRTVFAQEDDEATSPPVKFSGSLSVSEVYDDNVLDYSPLDLNFLENNLKPQKFEISSAADYVNVLQLRLGVKGKWLSSPTIVNVRYHQYLYGKTHLKNFVSWAGEVKQYFWTKNYVSLAVDLSPHSYSRDLYYVQPRNPYLLRSRYIQAFYNKKGFSAAFGRKMTRQVTGEFEYQYAFAEYNPEFVERNSRLHRFNVQMRYNISRIIQLRGAYRYSNLFSYGREILSANIADVSSKSNRGSLGVDYSMRKLLTIPVSISLDYYYEHIIYISDKLYDPGPPKTGDQYHFGRLDNFSKIVVELSYPFLKVLDASVEYSWEENKTNLPVGNDSGSYQTHRFGIGMKYSF